MLKDWLAFDDSDFKETILDCMGDGVVAADCNGFITYMNPAAAAILGCGADERRGAHFDSVFTLRDFDSGDSQESLFSKTMLSCSSIGLRNRSVLKANDGTEKFISA
ncbi:MAG: PAS domain-containing protein, partial [Clostridiales bacterium]|nr:PAS domain-containing protein [Clostridiales bacterium]